VCANRRSAKTDTINQGFTMNAKSKTILIVAVAAALTGCRTAPSLVFGQSHTVGISMSGAAAEAGAELSIGYKDRDIAVVPVAIVSKDGAVNGQTMPVRSQVSSKRGTGSDTDSLSVLGQFQVNAKAKDQDVGLGKFFATGLAAQKLADGFSCKLSGDKCPVELPEETEEEETETPPPATAAR
jgi:hypothetical protein